jgi:hypothetical protein
VEHARELLGGGGVEEGGGGREKGGEILGQIRQEPIFNIFEVLMLDWINDATREREGIQEKRVALLLRFSY